MTEWKWVRWGSGYTLERHTKEGRLVQAGEIYRTSETNHGVKYRVWGVRQAVEPARGVIGWDDRTYTLLAKLEHMPVRDAQRIARLILLAGVTV